MKTYEDFINGLREDVKVPDSVWSQYMDTLEQIGNLSETGKEVSVMRRKKQHKSHAVMKAAVIAGVFAAAAGIFSCANPVAAAKLPLIGHIFDQVADSATYSGDYQNKTVLPETAGEGTPADTPESGTQAGMDNGIYKATANGVTVTASEVYSDGYSVYLTAKIESGAGGFADIPAHYTRRFGETTSQSVHALGTWHTGNHADTSLSNCAFEGKAIDDHTFIGMLKLDEEALLTDDDTLSLSLSELRCDTKDAQALSCISGSWQLSIPFSVDRGQCREIAVGTGAKGYRIEKVFVSPYQVIVFCEAPCTTLTPETYTREDFEAQWGEKNEEIAAAGDTPVTYEDMLNKKFYDYFEIAVYNQDGEALSPQYGDDGKFLFAVQDLDLQTLHIYLTDAGHEPELTKARDEQQAKDISILDAQIDL